MALESSNVATGQTIEADHHNKLRNDVVTNHTHASGEGGTVSHADLADGVLGSTYLTHDKINKHVQGTGTSSDPDDTGGDQGVHGLPASAAVCGSLQYSTNGPQLVIQAGIVTMASQSATVTFDYPFSGQLVSVVCTLKGNKDGPDNFPANLYIDWATVNGFNVKHTTNSFAGNQVYWIAVGTM